jgi:HD-GYP domain-containing protein (c-di-GMP phosphodiesterase class II)
VAKIRAAALVHDIGKINIPRPILTKPGSLTDAEFALVKRHATDGAAMVASLGDAELTAIVRSHHERIDGKGFPDGLSGDGVPLGAQILSISSDYYAAQSGRLSLKRYSAAEARALIRGGAGTRYETHVVEAFELALNDEPTDKPEDREMHAHEVMPGMVLSRDLLSPQGTLLLAAGFVFDVRVVKQLREFAGREGMKLQIFVKLPEGGQP